ncbi:O-antigen ligase family protein [Candidatus Dojkabacteria bacterium]|nr:O-antigen ligase family protein [Candidatus Dojkabacteria bacterium]
MGYILSVFLFILISGRLSFIVDILAEGEISPRTLTKVLWIVVYLVLLAIYLIYCRKSLRTLFDAVVTAFIRYKVVFISLGVFLLASAISLLTSYNLNESIMGLGYYSILISLFLVGIVLPKKSDSDTFKKGLLFSALILIIVGLTQYVDYRMNQDLGWFISVFDKGGFVSASAFNIRTADNGLFLRPSSLMIDTNVFAVFLAMISVFSVDLINKRKSMLLSTSVLILSLAMILLTASRTGYLALIVGFIVYYGHRFIMRKDGVKGRVYSSFLPLALTRLTLADFSANEHINYWIQSIKIFLKHPVLGIGIGNFPQYYRENIDSRVQFATPHSVYAKMLAEGGIIGILSFGFVVISLGLELLKRKSPLILGLFSIIVVGNITYDFFMTPWVWFLLGAFLSDLDW